MEVKLDSNFMDKFYAENPGAKEAIEAQIWCECPTEYDVVFHDDHVMPFESCVDKHHYHCGVCLGLKQIG